MTTLQEAARDALEALERIGKDFVCRSAHHAKKDQHSAFAECPVVVRHTDAIESLRTALAQQVAQKPVAVSDAMVEAYLTAQRKTVEEADRFGRPNVGGLHTNTVREACRNGISAALAAAPAPVAQQGEQQVCAGCGIPVGDVHMSTCKSGKWPSRVSNGDAPAPMTAKRAAYFMERFKKDEKLLGPNEQAAVAFVLEMLAQQGEPVAYLVYANGSRRYSTLTFDVNKVPEIYIGGEAIPLYTAAPAPQPAQDVPEVGFGNMPYSPYLFGGLRFKMNFDKSGNATNFHGVESALQGAWVALVDATDNRHLQSAQPVARPLTLEQLLDIVKKLGEPT